MPAPDVRGAAALTTIVPELAGFALRHRVLRRERSAAVPAPEPAA